jgi:hypothetical protein
MKSIRRFSPIFLAAGLLAAGFPSSVRAARFPPLNTPATDAFCPPIAKFGRESH